MLAHHGVSHQEYRYTLEFLLCMFNSPCNVTHLVLPTGLAISTTLALHLVILRRQPKSTLVVRKHRNSTFSNEWVEMCVPADVF